MSYRDDREALHNRVAQLEEELKDARREGQEEGRDEAGKRALELEEKIGTMKADLERMELELQAMRGERPKAAPAASKPVLIALGAIVALGVFGVIVGLTRRSAPPAPVIVMPPQLTVAPETAKIPIPEPPAAVATLEPPKAPPRSTVARWNAKVTKADGLALGGAACTVDATIMTSSATNAIIKDFKVTCGGQKLYDRSDQLEGMAQMSNDAREVLGPSDEKSTFTIVYRDIGTRSGERSQIDLDSTHSQASVWKDTIPRFKVDLSIAKESTPGTPLTTAADRLKRTGKLSEISGSPAKVGASCTLRAMPIGKGSDCVAEVACGTTVLWPTTAPVKCTYEGSRPATVEASADDTSLSIIGATLGLKTKTVTATIDLAD